MKKALSTVAVSSLALSLMTLVPVCFGILWLVKLVLIEWGHLAALVVGGVAVGIPTRWATPVARGLLLVSAVILIHPLVWGFWKFPGAPWKELLWLSGPAFETLEFVVHTENSTLPIVLYRAKAAAPSPLIISIHGGSWQSGDYRDMAQADQSLVGLGYSVASVSYRLAPTALFPEAKSDVEASLEYLIGHASALGLDAKRIVLLGRSAGGQLAATVSSARPRNILRTILLYSPSDLVWGYRNSRPWHIVNGKKVIPSYLGADLSDSTLAVYQAASPINGIRSGMPPVLLVHGANEDLVSPYHSRAYYQALQENQVPSELVEIPWATHAFDYFPRGPSSIVTRYAIRRFLEGDRVKTTPIANRNRN